MSEVHFDKCNRSELSTVTKMSPRNYVGADLEDPATPEVTELEHEEQLIPETEEECGCDRRGNDAKTEESVKLEEHTQKFKKRRRKSTSNNGSVSQPMLRPITTQPSCDKLQTVRNAVEQAIREHKTFSVQGTFPTIREAMRQRGWIEKETNRNKAMLSLDDASFPSSITLLASLTQVDGRTTEALLVARLLRNIKVDFLWTMRCEPIDWQAVQRKQIVNRFPRAHFTTKVGLCSYLQHMHWFCENDVSHILFPRCYNVCQPDELTAFTHDFRLTACLGLLKWLVSKYEKQGGTSLKSMEGKIPFTAVEFALKRCQEYIGIQTHEDIDRQDSIAIWDHQWDQFLTWYYLAVHDNSLLTECRTTSIVDLYESAKHVLMNIRKFWPQIDLDGMSNIWIVKPGAQSRGRGIQLTNKLEKVMEKVNPAAMKESRYVVQKYIECPLLIYDTKFDIRQWFLVTCAQPLTIWMYKESYLRFCSQPFDLISMHESVHLCNNAVQSKYKNGKRNPLLPDENMWDCYTFQTYLRGIGHADMWDKCIYPGMRQSIICTLLASQEHMDRRRNCFELFGADFMLSEDFSPWLIEINSCPCMQPTTSVTARMCSQCLEDVIKVVIDKRFDRNASTGMFELIYRQHMPQAPPYLGMNLSVRGTKVQPPVPRTRSANKAKKNRESSEEQESYNSGPDSNKKRKNIRVRSSYSKGQKMKNSSGSLEGSRCEDYMEGTIAVNKSETNSEGEELPTQQFEQSISQENTAIHSLDSSYEHNLVSSDTEYTEEFHFNANNSQFKHLDSVNDKPQNKLDRNHSSEELEFSDTISETLLENNPYIHSNNSTNCSSDGYDTVLHTVSSNSEEQQLPNRQPECVIQIVTLNISECHQSLSSSPENTPQIKQSRINESKYRSHEGESDSSRPELNIMEDRSVRVNNSEPGCTVYGTVTSGSNISAIQKSFSNSKEQELVKNHLQKTMRRHLKLMKFMENSVGSGSQLTMQNNNCNIEKMNDSAYKQHQVNSTSESTFQKKENIRMKNSRGTSESQDLTNNWSEHKRGRKRNATSTMSDTSEERRLFDGDTEHAAQKEISSEINMYESSTEQEIAGTRSENKALKNYYKTKNPSENRGLRNETEIPSQNTEDFCEKKLSNEAGKKEHCSTTEQPGKNSTENEEISKFSKIHKKIKKTAECVGPIIVNMTEDLKNEMNKTHKSERKRNETAIYATQEHKKTKPCNKPSSGSSTVVHGKVGQTDKETTIVIAEDRRKSEMQGRDIVDVQECEVLSKDVATKKAGASWPYAKHSPHVPNFTAAIYPTAEVILERKKHCSSGWKNSNDVEKSMEFFNDWKQKLDRTKASCEDILAKLKMVRDNENIINKPKYYSFDNQINWEGGTANTPTISDIIKKLSQTRPERELFMCNIRRQVTDTAPEPALSKSKVNIKMRQCDLNMTIEDNMKSLPQHNQRSYDHRPSITPHIHGPSVNHSPVSVAVLPNIKHKIKQPPSNNFFCSGHKLKNFYAIGMSSKTLQNSHNLKQHLLLPLGSDHCLGVTQLFEHS